MVGKANPIVVIDTIGGNCPVQAEGTINGKPFYFRARGSYWSIGIGGVDPGIDPEWEHDEKYSDELYAASWMTEDEARAFIDKAANLYAETGEK